MQPKRKGHYAPIFQCAEYAGDEPTAADDDEPRPATGSRTALSSTSTSGTVPPKPTRSSIEQPTAEELLRQLDEDAIGEEDLPFYRYAAATVPSLRAEERNPDPDVSPAELKEHRRELTAILQHLLEKWRAREPLQS